MQYGKSNNNNSFIFLFFYFYLFDFFHLTFLFSFNHGFILFYGSPVIPYANLPFKSFSIKSEVQNFQKICLSPGEAPMTRQQVWR